MDITPVFNRELLVAARRVSVWANRAFVVAVLLAIVLATFGARYYWDRGQVSSQDLMARAAFQAFLWMVLAHSMFVVGALTRASLSVGLEKDRRTLEFLLATRLSNAEIVLGKLGACFVIFITEITAGLPVMLLLNPLGSIDLRLILLTYAGLITTGVFLIALAIAVSTRVGDSRRGIQQVAILGMVLWLSFPPIVPLVYRSLGARMPEFLITANAWISSSSPLGLAIKIAGGMTPASGLAEAVAWMCGLQVSGAAVLVICAIAQLRSAYRANLSGQTRGLLARLNRPNRRWRPKPPVGDDPILWRETNVARTGVLIQVFLCVSMFLPYGVLAYLTYFFTRPALLEVWRNGYSSGLASAERPEWNLVIRLFTPDYGVNPPVDIARTELNTFLRLVTIPFQFIIMLVTVGMAGESIVRERARETWDSLIATPLSARDILRGKILAILWRMRLVLATQVGLWVIGLAAGAIHPVGFVASLLVLAALLLLMLTFGTFASIGSKDVNSTTGVMFLLVFFLSCSGYLPFLLPGRANSVFLGAGSPPFVIFTSLLSHRDVRNAGHYSVYPFLQWLRIDTGEGPLRVVATWLISILISTTASFYLWRFSLRHFDRLIGRPHKATRAVADEELIAVPATAR